MTDRIGEPPFLLDGHQVVRYAVIDASVPPPPHFHVVAGGTPVGLDTIRGLIVAEDLVSGGVYLMHCDDDWATVAADEFASADEAQRSAQSRYEGVAMAWHAYRQLSDSERREVEVTRDFLREMAAEFPNE
jgi:hypothetical protein